MNTKMIFFLILKHQSNEHDDVEIKRTHPSTGKLSDHANDLSMNRTITVNRCQTDFQPLDPNFLLKSSKKCAWLDRRDNELCSSSFQLSLYDSGFVDDCNGDSLVTSNADKVGVGTETHVNVEYRDRSILNDVHRTKSRHVTFQSES
jgi:hypothetical protein